MYMPKSTTSLGWLLNSVIKLTTLESLNYHFKVCDRDNVLPHSLYLEWNAVSIVFFSLVSLYRMNRSPDIHNKVQYQVPHSFFALLRKYFNMTMNHQLWVSDLQEKVNIWEKSPVSALCPWRPLQSTWSKVIENTLYFLSLEEQGKLVSYLEEEDAWIWPGEPCFWWSWMHSNYLGAFTSVVIVALLSNCNIGKRCRCETLLLMSVVKWSRRYCLFTRGRK